MTRLRDFVAGRSMSELYDAYWIPFVLEECAELLSDSVAPGNSVLDLACGSGIVSKYAALKAGPSGKVVGLDPTREMLDAARNKVFTGAPVEWVEGASEDMLFEDSTFDVVLCQQGLQYFPDREKSFSEIARVLKRGGILHAIVASSAADQTAFGFAEDSLAEHFGADQKPIHSWSFGGLDELRRLAEGANMAVEGLEKTSLDIRSDSIQQFVDVQITCAGHLDESGQMVLGLVDLDDEQWLDAIDGFSRDAHRELSEYVANGNLVAPFFFDELIAHT